MNTPRHYPRAEARSQAGLLAAASGRSALASLGLLLVVVLVLIRMIGGI